MAEEIYATFHTSAGEIVVKLLPEKAPKTVENFVGLAEGTREWTDPKTRQQVKRPLYDGTMFHRVIPDFMIQGGDPQGNGRGGPGYMFRNEIVASLKHDRAGTLSMANAGPDTNGSQFFITHKDTSWLDGKHTVFGHVVEGQDVVNKIVVGDTIKSVKIIRVGDKAKAFKGDEAAFQELSKKS